MQYDSPLEALERGRKFLSSKERWCSGSSHIIRTNQCCLMGACSSTHDMSASPELRLALKNSIRKLYPEWASRFSDFTIIHFNDVHTYEDVVAVLDDAISSEKFNVG